MDIYLKSWQHVILHSVLVANMAKLIDVQLQPALNYIPLITMICNQVTGYPSIK
jgi:hypothetical protein